MCIYSDVASGGKFVPHFPPKHILASPAHVSCFQFDPRDPVPSIGGNVFHHKNILLAGAYNQVEREDMFLCRKPPLPLSARRDVLPFRMTLARDLDVTGMPTVCAAALLRALCRCCYWRWCGWAIRSSNLTRCDGVAVWW